VLLLLLLLLLLLACWLFARLHYAHAELTSLCPPPPPYPLLTRAAAQEALRL
jgi:hypothetical protein